MTLSILIKLLAVITLASALFVSNPIKVHSIIKEPEVSKFEVNTTILLNRYSGGGVVEMKEIGGNEDKVRITLSKAKPAVITVDKGAPDLFMSEPWMSKIREAIHRVNANYKQ